MLKVLIKCVYNLTDFGVKKVKQLVERFERTLLSQSVETEEICHEWQIMKSLLYKGYALNI